MPGRGAALTPGLGLEPRQLAQASRSMTASTPARHHSPGIRNCGAEPGRQNTSSRSVASAKAWCPDSVWPVGRLADMADTGQGLPRGNPGSPQPRWPRGVGFAAKMLQRALTSFMNLICPIYHADSSELGPCGAPCLVPVL